MNTARADSAARQSVIVVGGGIGGLPRRWRSRARAWRCNCWNRRRGSARSARALLGPNAFAALDALGVGARASAPSSPTIIMMDAVDAREVVRIDTGEDFRARFGGPYAVIHRADIHLSILEAVRQEPLIRFHTSTQIADVSQQGGRAEVVDTQGRRYQADAVIGADGVKSVIRQRMVGDPVRVTGHVVYRAVVERDNMPEELRINAPVLWAGPHCHLVTTRAAASNTTWSSPSTAASRRNGACATAARKKCCRTSRTYTRARTRCWTGPLRGSVATADREPVEHWGQGRVTLLGDAAHPMTQYMAQGACMALEDAVTLGEAVRACGHDLEAAFRRYESVRIPRSARVVWSTREMGRLSRARRRTHRAQFAVDRPQPVPVPGRVAMALRLESGAMPRGTHPAIENRHRRRRHEARIDPRRRPHCRNTRRQRVPTRRPPCRRVGRHAAGAVRARRRRAAKPVDIGFIGTLSTPAGYIGEDERDAFMLAVQEGGGKLGGCRSTCASRMTRSPANAKQSADRMVQSGVRLFTGVNFRTCWPQSRPPCSMPAASTSA